VSKTVTKQQAMGWWPRQVIKHHGIQASSIMINGNGIKSSASMSSSRQWDGVLDMMTTDNIKISSYQVHQCQVVKISSYQVHQYKVIKQQQRRQTVSRYQIIKCINIKLSKYPAFCPLATRLHACSCSSDSSHTIYALSLQLSKRVMQDGPLTKTLMGFSSSKPRITIIQHKFANTTCLLHCKENMSRKFQRLSPHKLFFFCGSTLGSKKHVQLGLPACQFLQIHPSKLANFKGST
jgi:hypothetical protein